MAKGSKHPTLPDSQTGNGWIGPLTLEQLEALARSRANWTADELALLDAALFHARAGLEKPGPEEMYQSLCRRVEKAEHDTERLEWIVSHLWFGILELEPKPGLRMNLSVMADDTDCDALAHDWRARIDAQRGVGTESSE